MALLHIDLFSRCLMRTVPVTAIVPVDNVRYEGEPEREAGKPYKTLYLLNGGYGNNSDWTLASDIFGWATAQNLAVVMPAGENHFYVDCAASGEAFGRFIGEELPALTRRLFPLSHRREDTFIAGLSMGGYGAVRNGLKYANTFGWAAGLSSAFLQDTMLASDNTPRDFTRTRRYYESIFGDLNKLAGSDADPKALYVAAKATGVVPELYLAIGTEDFLLQPNRAYKKFLESQGANFVYEEGPGGHDFTFWNSYLRRVLDWLPLEEEAQGISSGNVHQE